MGKKRGAVERAGDARKRHRSSGRKANQGSKVASVHDQNQDVEVDEEDMEFVLEYGKDLDFLANIDGSKLDDRNLQLSGKKGGSGYPDNERKDSEEYSSDDCGDELEYYERKPRGGRKEESVGDEEKADPSEPSKMVLPIKTPSGEVVFEKDKAPLSKRNAEEMAGQVEGIVVEDMMDLNGALDNEGEEVDEPEDLQEVSEDDDVDVDANADEVAAVEKPVSDHADTKSTEEMRQKLREKMAVCASKVMKHPEDNISELKHIIEMLKDDDSQIQRLAMVSMLAIFKDICPGYRIRLPTEKEKAVKVSKEVAKLRAYEAFLLRCYQVFLKQLLSFQQAKEKILLSRVSARCACDLLASLHHFNYSSDLMHSVIPHLCSSDAAIRKLSSEAVAKAMEGDNEGKVTLEVVQLVGDLVKRKKCRCPQEVMDSLMGLTFPDINLSRDQDEEEPKKQKKRKKSRKDDVEKSFKAATADPDKERKATYQSQTVDALFEIFFRVLKDCARVTRQPGATTGSMSSGEVQEKCPMLYQALRGLSKYAHVLSVEYFQDLLDVFRQLLNSVALPCLERLCCLLTTSEILQGQGEALNVDQRDFYQQLYWTLRHWPAYLSTDDILDGDDGQDKQAEEQMWSFRQKKALDSIEQLEALLIQVLNQMLCTGKAKDNARLGAFLKRLLSVGSHQGCSLLMGIQGVINRLLLRHFRLRSMLDGDGGAPAGGKGYNPQVDDPAEAFALSTTLWELTILAKHYHPHVSQGAQDLAKIPVDSGRSSADVISGVLSAVDGPLALVSRYNTSKGTFWPVPKAPAKMSKIARKSFTFEHTQDFTDLMEPCSKKLDALEDEHLAMSLQECFRENVKFRRNSLLRKRLGIEKMKVHKFKDHLNSKPKASKFKRSRQRNQ